MRYYLIAAGTEAKTVELSGLSENNYLVTVDGIEKTATLRRAGGKTFVSFDEGLSFQKLVPTIKLDTLTTGSKSYTLSRGFIPSGLGGGAEGALVSEMPGKVVKVYKGEGDEVKVGDTLVILEAMKMENEIKATVDGIVKAVHVKEGQAIESNTTMLEIE